MKESQRIAIILRNELRKQLEDSGAEISSCHEDYPMLEVHGVNKVVVHVNVPSEDATDREIKALYGSGESLATIVPHISIFVSAKWSVRADLGKRVSTKIALAEPKCYNMAVDWIITKAYGPEIVYNEAFRKNKNGSHSRTHSRTGQKD